jgi:hypothetical protein
VSQYVEDYRSGNASLRELLNGAVFAAYYAISQAGIGAGPAMRWFYDKAHPLWGGTPFPRQPGTIPLGQGTPIANLQLRPGELVRIKPLEEVLATLDVNNRNRGMFWDAEEVPFCGQSYRVLGRVERIVNERTGQMLELKTPGVILDSVVCQARFSQHRMLCPRSIHPYFREIWLERLEPAPAGLGLPTVAAKHATAASGSDSEPGKARAASAKP